MPVEDKPWQIDNGNLWVSNIDYDPQTEDTKFDFLLNYLVARGGIPKKLREHTPGMKDPKETSLAQIGSQLQRLGAFVSNGGRLNPEELQRLAQKPVPLNESCSDCHYP